MYLDICMHVCMYACMYVCVLVYPPYIHTYMHVCMHTSMGAHNLTYSCVYTYLFAIYITWYAVLAVGSLKTTRGMRKHVRLVFLGASVPQKYSQVWQIWEDCDAMNSFDTYPKFKVANPCGQLCAILVRPVS